MDDPYDISTSLGRAVTHEPVLSDQQLLEYALAHTRAGDGISGVLTLGNYAIAAAIWRLLERIEGYKAALENVTSVAPHSGSDTSRAAAKSIAPVVTELRAKVLAAIITFGATTDEIERITGLAGNSVRPRLIEMQTLGWVERTDEKRLTRSQREAYVWKITDEGRAELRRWNSR